MSEINQKIAVTGSARNGRRLALELAAAGFEIVFDDLMPGAMEEARSEVRAKLDERVAAGRLTQEAADAAFARIEFVPTLEEALRSSRIVAEAGPDDLESKLEMFSLLERICKPETTILSTARNFSVSFVSSVTMRWTRIIEMHFNDKEDGSLAIELVRSAQTSSETVELARSIASRITPEVTLRDETSAEAGS